MNFQIKTEWKKLNQIQQINPNNKADCVEKSVKQSQSKLANRGETQIL